MVGTILLILFFSLRILCYFCSGQPKPDQANVLAHAQQQIAMQVTFEILFQILVLRILHASVIRFAILVLDMKGSAIA